MAAATAGPAGPAPVSSATLSLEECLDREVPFLGVEWCHSCP